MKPTPCPRLFEAEALRDGRLAGAELASFERHATSCSACSNEVRALEALAGALRASPPSNTDELHARRERTRLLAAFNRSLVAPERGAWPRRLLLLPAAVTLLGALLFAYFRTPVPARPTQAAHGVVVRGDSAARWSERTESDGKRLIVERGALWIHVDHRARSGRLLVELPDGELEDTGTTFTLTVENGRTTRVAVEEGSVLLRIRGQLPVALGPGEHWMSGSPAEGRRPLTGPSSAAPPPEPPRSAPLPAPARSAPAALGPDPSLDFRGAMAALHAGSNREAAAAFASFLGKHPRDPRAEDAAYLRIIALQRSGDQAAMRDAALAYFRRYPKGFRRAEAERLSR